MIPGIPWVKLGIGLAIIMTIGAGYLYVTNLQKRLEETRIENQALTIKATAAEKNLSIAVASMKKAAINAKKTDQEMQAVRKERDEAKKVLDDDNRLERLAKARSSLLTIRARAATERLYQDFEDLSRNPPGGSLH